jgi:predicted component of viral defense system (DUF524 family)
MKSADSVRINLDFIEKDLFLTIEPRKPGTLFDAKGSFEENNEARFQLVEGCYYDYEVSDESYILKDPFDSIVREHKRRPNLGTIAPNIYVGTLEIPILDKLSGNKVDVISLEVQSVKSGYRDDYRDMLAFITEKCTDLLLKANSPVAHNFEVDHEQDSHTLYQRFAFIKSVIHTSEFAEAIHRVVKMPVTQWIEIHGTKDIRNARRLSNKSLKEVLRSRNRRAVPEKNRLRDLGIKSLPERIYSAQKIDSVDTPENRFIKHALETFLKFCLDINQIALEREHRKLLNESSQLIHELENQLQHSFFTEISNPTLLKLNSPVLQRKEGYREVLRVWLMFDLAAKLVWAGGEDVYGAGKRDIATLYEYWLFFKLLDLFEEVFDIHPKDIDDLIQPTSDGLSLQIKQGKSTPLEGVFKTGSRTLNIRFNYNRSFSGKKEYPKPGSWTTTLRPDYTVSFWPQGITEEDAERQELIVHIHFDAKYKVANFISYLDGSVDAKLDEEKKEHRKGIYKNADLLKMHAYKDAIRRTGGAYVLYPGAKGIKKTGFHEIIPGLGAFPVRPSKTDSGMGELKTFILEITEHFLNRASQREKAAFQSFDIYRTPPNEDDTLKEALPEAYRDNRSLLPDYTSVLIGYYRSDLQYQWIRQNQLYNFRAGIRRGSVILDKETVSAKYLLLHTKGDAYSGDLWKIVGRGPKYFSKEDMRKKGYPGPKGGYLVFSIEPVSDSAFENLEWDFKSLKNYSSGRSSALPFTASLTELMHNKVE